MRNVRLQRTKSGFPRRHKLGCVMAHSTTDRAWIAAYKRLTGRSCPRIFRIARHATCLQRWLGFRTIGTREAILRRSPVGWLRRFMWLHTICCCTFFLCGLPEAGIATHAFGTHNLSRPTHIQAKAKEMKYPMGETAQIVLRTHGCWSYDSRRRRRLVCSLAPLPTDITIFRRTCPNRCSGPFPKC
jgi:hypothetical protein